MPRPRFREPLSAVSVNLYDRQIDLLRAESIMTGAPLSALVRRELDKTATQSAALDGEAHEARA